VAIGAILTQNTAWTNVEKAIANLKSCSGLSFKGLQRMSDRQLSRAIRPSGYYNQKTIKLRAFLEWLIEHGGRSGSLKRALSGPLDEVRGSLLSVKGIGPETADSILLYAGDRLTFVVDAYTRRILGRHSICRPDSPYEELRALLQGCLPRKLQVYNEFHALLVRLAKDHCSKRSPRCDGCPLAEDPERLP
jgi:endonuclease-3 related protein